MTLNWIPIASAPANQDLRLSVIDKGEVHTLVFPCRRSGMDWIDARKGKHVDINPTHWQLWDATA